ncbi:MAG: hypothetical protein P8L75_03450 [Gammaproteobacteria bacterium]|nr:hypothetical protein [Gammaproteobacteria bacterium]
MKNVSKSFGKINKIILLGGSWLTAEFLKLLSEKEIEVILYTSKRHYDEIVNTNGNTLREVSNILNVPSFVIEDINNDPTLHKNIDEYTLGIAIGAAWVFEPETVKLFNGKLLDFMGIALPKYRGGAHYTWQILANNKSGACNLQIVYGGKESFHKGEIIKRSEYLFPESVRIPQDYFNFAIRKETLFLAEFLNEVHEDKNFALVSLDESISSYYPFLNTKSQGWINWNWSAEEIDRFICAFDEPYEGASALLNGNRVYLKKCRYVKSNSNFHPFHSGLIYRRLHDSIFISARGGALVLKQVINDNGQNIIEFVQEGQRFTTPANKLESALSFDAKYGSNGLTSSA